MGMGGAQKQVLNLITSDELRAYRHSILCIIAYKGEFLQPALDLGIPVEFCPIRWPARTIFPSYRINRWLRDKLQVTFPWRLARALKQLDATLVHTYVTTSMYWQAKAVLQLAKLPWIWTICGLYKTRGENVEQWPSALRLITKHDKARITGVSHAALREVEEYGIVQPHKLSVIYNGIHTDHFRKAPHLRLDWRKQWGIPENAVVFGTAGRLIDVKRHDLTIRAFSKLAARQENIHFVLAGVGPLRHKLEQLVQAFGLQGRFHLVGFQQDMNKYLNAIDVFILASDSESFANVLVEASALSVPCIATAVGGIPEVIGDAGLLIPPDSDEALASAMTAMLSAAEREKYASKSVDVVSRFSLTQCARQYEALYHDLLSP